MKKDREGTRQTGKAVKETLCSKTKLANKKLCFTHKFTNIISLFPKNVEKKKKFGDYQSKVIF